MILRLWLVNLIISIALYVSYRMVIAGIKPMDTTLLEKILYIIDVLLNLGFSIIYFAMMVLGSLTFFLNRIEKIKNNPLLSFLTFSGIPFVCVIFLAADVSMNICQYNESPLKTPLVFSIIYLLCTVTEFLMFRKKVKNS